jgi:hypothetical protein
MIETSGWFCEKEVLHYFGERSRNEDTPTPRKADPPSPLLSASVSLSRLRRCVAPASPLTNTGCCPAGQRFSTLLNPYYCLYNISERRNMTPSFSHVLPPYSPVTNSWHLQIYAYLPENSIKAWRTCRSIPHRDDTRASTIRRPG